MSSNSAAVPGVRRRPREEEEGDASKKRQRIGRLFVGNLAPETSEASVRDAFAKFGTVTDCYFPKDRATGQPRGFGFVTLRTASEAAAAVDGSLHIDGRTLRVNAADDDDRREKKEQKPRYAWGKPEEDETEEEVVEKQKPDFGLSGALAKDEATGNTRRGHVLKFVEPDDAAKPTDRWRIYVFKGDDLADTLHIHRQSAFLVGRLKDIVDVLTMHPSCSTQHAVLQFRRRPIDDRTAVLPYVMDLGSTNGTFLNGAKLDPARYYELREKDVLKFGNSSRDYVFLRADS
mmetsp:Transcript_14134/g.42751  ORF Transcript_14134/g.42751 Transcript_14134/m.42751 type:complete len:289 (-) Transcript_14134:43-909(-)